ncbi:sigma-70 family RNA polymerase sigma factor [Calycomorphotria hydatis]|uniref:RNA polymerase sigma factor RpoE n=1 Tax=Calycomorphotria hydatis TaxID=2528027 RepID=A0A517TE61_9PLAN|nr:sigma-70 family RNA polymerase sigma factor [Calycomorphotria hydatis]QDT66665.1 RNA polymerase sigma factor RpoE [Calycomorphotria hydatis]
MTTDAQHQTFHSLFEESVAELRSYVGSLVLNISDADDVFQELCITLWEHFDEFDRSRSFIAWARVYAFNAARTYWKNRKRRMQGAIDPAVLEKLSKAHKVSIEVLEMRREKAQACLERLPRVDQQFIHDVYEKRVPIQQLAQERNKKPGTLRKRLFNLRQQIKRCVERSR